MTISFQADFSVSIAASSFSDNETDRDKWLKANVIIPARRIGRMKKIYPK